jgi:hypothetical protein
MRIRAGLFFFGGIVLITAEMEVPDVTWELKYCEFCGALWLRPRGSSDPYCGKCTEWIESELPRIAQGEA